MVFIQGNIVFNGYNYLYKYDQQENYLHLHTHDQEYDIGVEFICKETGDTERRWREFHKIFARSVAKNRLGIQ